MKRICPFTHEYCCPQICTMGMDDDCLIVKFLKKMTAEEEKVEIPSEMKNLSPSIFGV